MFFLSPNQLVAWFTDLGTPVWYKCGAGTLTLVSFLFPFCCSAMPCFLRGEKYCDQHSVCLYVWMSVRFSACMSQKSHEFLCAYYLRSWIGDSARRYVLPVLWMTSRSRIMGHMEHENVYITTNVLRGFHSLARGRSLLSATGLHRMCGP